MLIVGGGPPRRDGGPHAAVLFSYIAALRGLGWAIEFVASGELARGDDAVAVLKAWDVTCHRAPAVASVEEVLRRRRAAFALVSLAGLPNTRAYAALARLWQPRARLVCGLAVQDRTDAGPLRLVDVTIVPSAADAASLALRAPGAPVHVVPWAPCPEDGSIRGSRRHGIGFIGRPNDPGYADAVSWLTGAIMPAVWQRDPRMSCLMAGFGRSVDGRIRYLASAEEVLAHVCLTVAPIRPGTGPTTLVLDSFAAGVPGVMTPAAAAGLALDDVLRTAVAEDVGAMADLICDLYFQPALHRRHAEAGLALVRGQYSPDAVAAAMAVAVGSATAPAMPRKGTAVARAG